MTAEKRRRSLTRWFRFGLRSALVGFTLLCLLLALVVLPYHRALREHRAVNELLANRHVVVFSNEKIAGGILVDMGQRFKPEGWLERLTGTRLGSHAKEVVVGTGGYFNGMYKPCVELLSDLRQLERVTIDAKDSEIDVQHLAGLRKLKRLSISSSSISGGSPELFSRLPELTHLSLLDAGDGPTITDRHLSGLRNSKLATLEITSREVNGSFLNALAHPQSLRYLSLSGCAVDDSGAEVLGRFRSLEVLDLSSTRITDHGIEHLAGLEELRILILDETEIGDRSLEVIAGLPNLECRSLVDTRICDGDLASLAPAPRLRLLDVRRVALRNEAIIHLARFPALRVVYFLLPRSGVNAYDAYGLGDSNLSLIYSALDRGTPMDEVLPLFGNDLSQIPLCESRLRREVPNCEVYSHFADDHVSWLNRERRRLGL